MEIVGLHKTSRASRRSSQRCFCSVIQLMSSLAVSISSRQGRRWASTPWLISPDLSSTLMCFETACRLIVNGSANSFTVASPAERRETIARRVGSAKAEKAASSRSSVSVRIPHFYANFSSLACRPLHRIAIPVVSEWCQ
jgi:hypothetical protein